MRIFMSAGEPSGDLHGANLIRAIRKRMPDAEIVGFGGDLMEQAGARLIYRLVDLAVMWFVGVLLNLHKFFGLLAVADRYFREQRPDAVIVIDNPGFHWELAKRAKRHGIPVFYHVPPQIWAWAGWRVEKVRKYVDHVLCSLPFEPAWYHERGVPGADFIGHPYFDELWTRKLDESFLKEQRALGGPVVLLLPGSRTLELRKNLPTMLRSASLLSKRRADLRFVVACLHEKHRLLAERMAQDLEANLSLDFYAGRTPELIKIADVAWAVSGSVGLELLFETLPSVVLYKMRAFDLWIASFFIKSKYISLVNLLADRELFPEYLTHEDVSSELADWAQKWLDDESERSRVSEALAELRAHVAAPGASDRAAERILGALATSVKRAA